MHQNAFAPGALSRTPSAGGAYSVFPDLLAGFGGREGMGKGNTNGYGKRKLKGKEGRGEKGRRVRNLAGVCVIGIGG